jgi:tryptophan-rich sensory protein
MAKKIKRNGKVWYKKIDWKGLILLFLFVHVFALIGSFFTNTKSDWYHSIKLSLIPPGFVFGIVWTILFLLIWISFYLALTKSKKEYEIVVLTAFFLNLVLNAIWSIIFFGMQSPIAAFVELIVLWLSIGLMMIVSLKVSKLSAWLLLPYLVWVSFAGVLNYLIAFG